MDRGAARVVRLCVSVTDGAMVELLSLRPATEEVLSRPATAAGLALLRPATREAAGLSRPATAAGLALLRPATAAGLSRPATEEAPSRQCLPAGEEVPRARLPSASPCCQRGPRVRTRRTFSPSATVAAEAVLAGRALLGVVDHAEVREGSMGAVVGEQIGCEECLAAGCLGAADHAEGRQGSMEAVVGEQIGCEAGRQGAGQVAVACGLLWVLLSRSLPDSYATRIAMCSIRPDG